MIRKWTIGFFAALIGFAVVGMPGQGHALDKVRAAIGHKVIWDSGVVFALPIEKGIFRKHGIEMDMTFTRGGTIDIQMMVQGEVDVAPGVGVLAALKAYSQGAPVRIIAAEFTGSEFFWYARPDRGIKGMADFDGKTLGHNMPGTSAHVSALALKEHLKNSMGKNLQLIMAGRMGDNITQTLSGQIDMGYGVPPFGLKLIEQGKLMIVARGRDIPSLVNRTTRARVAHADFVTKKRPVAIRFMKALTESLDWVHGAGREEAIAYFAKLNKLPLKVAREASSYYGREMFNYRPFKGLDVTMGQAVEFGILKKPLNKAQLDELIDVVYEPGKS